MGKFLLGMKIFISAVSAQFKDCRNQLRSDLTARGHVVRVQEDFQQGPGTLLQRLEEYVAECNCVIIIVGNAYGVDPQLAEVPLGCPARSYTQWEYFFTAGERLNGARVPRKQFYLYFASEKYLHDHVVTQSPDLAERQRLFVEELKASGKFWATFDTPDHFCRLVLRDLPEMSGRTKKPSNLPYISIGSLFKGRDQFLQDLHTSLHRGENVVAVAGLGGVGKTRLAVEYAHGHEADHTALLFVAADTSEALQRNLAALCGPQMLDLPEHNAKEEDVRVAAVLRWLRQHPGWLLIIDSVDTLSAVSAVENVLPHLSGGQVVITSRVSNWSSGVEQLGLDVLEESDAIGFLLARTESQRRTAESDVADADSIAKELGGLALALEQAGAFITKLHISIGDYLRRWREREKKVLQWHDENLMKYPRSVSITWETTVNQLDPPARALLQILCWFAPEPIPRAILQTDSADRCLAGGVSIVEWSEPRLVDALMEDALAMLAGFSLLKWEANNDAVTIHRLVQEFTRERLSQPERTAWLEFAVILLAAYLPDEPPPHDVRSWPMWEPARAHVTIVLEAADVEGIAAPASSLMNRFALLLMEKGVWAEGEHWARRALAIDENLLGPHHPDIASHLSILGSLLRASNRLTEAEPLYRRALDIVENSYDAPHPKVAVALNNLAGLLLASNRLTEAERLYRRALAIDEECLGPDDPGTARDLNNLALLLQDTNRLTEAEALFRRALDIDEKSSGLDHPNVASRLNNLARLLHGANRPAEAEPMYGRALAIQEKWFGPHHPYVATTLDNLAVLLRFTGRPDEAEPMYRRALAIDETSFGLDHPKVAIRLNNLANLLGASDRAVEAEALFRRALAIDEKSRVADHPETAICLINLAGLLQSPDRLSEAEALTRRALLIFDKFREMTGYDHPAMPTALEHFASTLKKMGLTEEEIMSRMKTPFFQ